MEIEHGGAVVVVLLLDVEFVFAFKVFLSQNLNVLFVVCAFLAGSFFTFLLERGLLLLLCVCGASSLVLFAAVYCYLCTFLVVVVVKLNSSIIHRLGINVLRCICLVCLLQVGEKEK